MNLDVVVSEELCAVAWCVGSGVIVLKYNAIQRLIGEIKQKKSVSMFE